MYQTLLSPLALETLTRNLPENYSNPQKIHIHITKEMVTMCLRIWNAHPGSFNLWNAHSPEDFIREMNICRLSDLDTITEESLWAQYRKSNGLVWSSLDDLEGASLAFRTEDEGTVIVGEDIGYYDEQSGVWDSAELFVEYARTHMFRVCMAAEGEE